LLLEEIIIDLQERQNDLTNLIYSIKTSLDVVDQKGLINFRDGQELNDLPENMRNSIFSTQIANFLNSAARGAYSNYLAIFQDTKALLDISSKSEIYLNSEIDFEETYRRESLKDIESIDKALSSFYFRYSKFNIDRKLEDDSNPITDTETEIAIAIKRIRATHKNLLEDQKTLVELISATERLKDNLVSAIRNKRSI